MATKKISELTEVTSPIGSDVFPIVNGGETKKVQLTNVKDILGIEDLDTRLTDVETTSNCSTNLIITTQYIASAEVLTCFVRNGVAFISMVLAPVAQTLGTSKYSLFTGIPTPSATAQIPAVVFTNNIVPIRLSIDVNGTVYWHYNPTITAGSGYRIIANFSYLIA